MTILKVPKEIQLKIYTILVEFHLLVLFSKINYYILIYKDLLKFKLTLSIRKHQGSFKQLTNQ